MGKEKKKYIFSLNAIDILKNRTNLDEYIESNNDKFVWNKLSIEFSDCLDKIELERIYSQTKRKKMYYVYKNRIFTNALISVIFSGGDVITENYEDIKSYLSKNNFIDEKGLMSYLYKEGFYLNKIHFVRYKRSSASTREGKCLFIDEALLKKMNRFSNCGLKQNGDLASWESYRALTLSTMKDMIKIPLDSILFIPDYTKSFKEKAIVVSTDSEKKLIVKKEETEIESNIWDGESLLDESLFTHPYENKHFFLLRNKFFKSCAFKTKLQKWFFDNQISLNDLKNRGFITLAKNVEDIKMVVTPSSLKYLKFVDGLNQKNIEAWINEVSEDFALIKYDKRTSFFNGKMVKTNYQLLNTLYLSFEETKQLLQPMKDYLSLIIDKAEFARFHIEKAFKGEKEEKHDNISNDENDDLEFDSNNNFSYLKELQLANKMLKLNSDFCYTRLYQSFLEDIKDSIKNDMARGRILVSGTNATLFGNGPEILDALAGKFKYDSDETSRYLKQGEVYCNHFKNGQQLIGSRAPHVTMGNIYLCTNKLDEDIFSYFDLGENIVCVNAIDNDIQQRLNGCDYDSDFMLLSDNPILINGATKYNGQFLVPVCNIMHTKRENISLVELDMDCKKNKIGEIINYSQCLNSKIWDEIHNGKNITDVEVQKYYEVACILDVLSGIEIDKAKRNFPINTGKTLQTLKNKGEKNDKPLFLFNKIKKYDIMSQYKSLNANPVENKKELKRMGKYYNTTMNYILENSYYKSSKHNNYPMSVIDILRCPEGKVTSTDYRKKTQIIQEIKDRNEEINCINKKIKQAEHDSKLNENKKKLSILKVNEKELKKKLYNEDKTKLNEDIQNKLKGINEQRKKITNFLHEVNSRGEIPQLRSEKNQRKESLYEYVEKNIDSEELLFIIIKELTKVESEKKSLSWNLFGPLINHSLFLNLVKDNPNLIKEVKLEKKGTYDVFGQKYTIS